MKVFDLDPCLNYAGKLRIYIACIRGGRLLAILTRDEAETLIEQLEESLKLEDNANR